MSDAETEPHLVQWGPDSFYRPLTDRIPAWERAAFEKIKGLMEEEDDE
jgi:hypothetical protein